MSRQRLHTLDDLLDVAEQIVTSGDPSGLTLRALAAAAGASNGTIYHAFGSDVPAAGDRRRLGA